jgi:hypothetical protein
MNKDRHERRDCKEIRCYSTPLNKTTRRLENTLSANTYTFQSSQLETFLSVESGSVGSSRMLLCNRPCRPRVMETVAAGLVRMWADCMGGRLSEARRD